MLTETAFTIAESGDNFPQRVGDSPQSAKKPAPPRVLVVEDEPLIRWSIAETLGARGYEVIEAGSGAAAIYALMDPPGATAAVLLDLLLPDFDDLSLLAAMRRLAPSTPIIVMTAYGTPDLVEGARRLGAYGVMDKPFEMNDLAPFILRALGGSRVA